MNRDILQDLNTLRPLIAQLRAGEISAIEFGDPEVPKGFMSHHRIRIIATPAGSQVCFKYISRGMEGSGDYMGDATDREIEIRAQSYLERYFATPPFWYDGNNAGRRALLQRLRETRSNDKLTYFGIKD
jgi:hypothetical protein